MRKRIGGYGQDLKALEGERGTNTDQNQKKERQQIHKKCSVCGNQFWVDKAVMFVILILPTKISSHQKLQYPKIYKRRYVFTAQFAIIPWCCGQQSGVNSKVRDFGDVPSIQTAEGPQITVGVVKMFNLKYDLCGGLSKKRRVEL